MMHEFIEFVYELFPSIKSHTKDRVKASITQFQKEGKQFNCFLYKPFDFLAQGDIIESLPFKIFKPDGNEYVMKTKGILLSNTCDAENDSFIAFSPLLPVKELNVDKYALINNLIYRFLYFPEPNFSEYVIDLTLIHSFPKNLVNSAIKDGRIKKLGSLNDFGYYLFLCKLTVHFMRPEDCNVQNNRIN